MIEWPADSWAWSFLVRSSAGFMLALLVCLAFRLTAGARKALWLAAFSVPILLLLPIPGVKLAVLPPRSYSEHVPSRVYELEPGFAQFPLSYGEDAGIGPVMFALILGAVVGWSVLVWQLLRARKVIRQAEQVTDERLVALVYELGQQQALADAPVLLASDQIDSPCAYGVLNPVILVPSGLAESFDDAEWRIVLNHEIAHLAARDPLRILFLSVVKFGLWWNPLVWLARREATLAQEQAVDRKIADRYGIAAYSNVLTDRVPSWPIAGLARLFGRGHLFTRLRALGEEERRHSALWRWAILPLFAPVVVPIKIVPSYSPSPKQLARDEVIFHSERGDPSGYWRMRSDGGSESRMPALFDQVSAPTVSHDGRWLAYCRTYGRQEDIYIARLDGTGERLVVRTPGRDFIPLWSPDDRELLFSTTASGNWEIGLVDLRTGEWKYVTHDGNRNLEADWHPNGDRIVFSSHRTGAQKLWSMNLDGSDLVQLTYGGWEDTAGRYSRDGRYLLYSSDRRTKHDLWLMDLKTRESVPLSRWNDQETGDARWVDGDTAIVHTSREHLDAQIGRIDLGSRLRRITSEGQNAWPATR